MAAVLGLLVMVACGGVDVDVDVDDNEDPSITVPVEWSNVDIGSVVAAGAVVMEDEGRTLVVLGSGEDVYGTSDSFHYVHAPLVQDGSITARVRNVEEVATWTKAGVMVRTSTSADAANVFMLLTPSSGSVMQARESAGFATIEPGFDRAPRAPYWLRIVRDGDVFTGLQSDDGVQWSEVGSVTVEMPEQVLIGVAVSSNLPSELAEAVFSDIKIVPRSIPPGPTPAPDPDPVPGPGPVPPPLPGPIVGPTVSASYVTDGSSFMNPERGWYVERHPSDYGLIRSGGVSLVMRYVRLDGYRTQVLPASVLSGLQSDFDQARAAGVKVILRFAYNRGYEPDAPLSWVLQHIAQLAPVLQANSDVIATLQAGFIGYWGEWHGTANNLLTVDSRRAIVSALLESIDASRMIQIRYPYRASDLYPTPPTAATAFNGSDASRVGQLNDCFVANASDGGTFTSPQDYIYKDQVTPFTVMGGETCGIGGLSARNDCPVALAELNRFNYDYLNLEYYRGILDKWQSQGCYTEVDRRLGYRFVMQSATSAATVASGDALQMVIRMENQGFGKLYNPRPLEVVLVPRAGGPTLTLHAYDDARLVLPASGEVRDVAIAVRIPAGAAAGMYDTYLRLPDASSRLASDPRYSIRTANVGTWIASSGLNELSLPVEVNP